MFYSTESKCDGSFAKVDSSSLIELAHQSLENIEKYKKQEVQRLINRKRNKFLAKEEKRKNSLWSKLFGFKPRKEPTDEEIYEFIKNDHDDVIGPSELFWMDLRYEKYIDTANRLINAAKYAPEVFVSTEDLERLL